MEGKISSHEREVRGFAQRMREVDLTEGAAYDLRTLADRKTMTLENFHPGYLTADDPADHPLEAATRWLSAANGQDRIDSYRSGEPAALFFLGTQGRGKTHLAIALLLATVQRYQKRAAFLNELQYRQSLKSLPFGKQLGDLVSDPGERAWLTVFDDIGKFKPESSRDRSDIQAAWYQVLDKRYNLRRWTIFTGEKPLEELVKQGTFDKALAGRVNDMTRGYYVVFDGSDVRLREADL